MIRGGFLSEEDRNALIALARDGSAAGRVPRRANALALLDGGMVITHPYHGVRFIGMGWSSRQRADLGRCFEVVGVAGDW
jgi:hypothetical protein